MRKGLARWMEARQFGSLADVRGRLSLKNSPDPAAFERANYLRTLSTWAELLAYQMSPRAAEEETPDSGGSE